MKMISLRRWQIRLLIILVTVAGVSVVAVADEGIGERVHAAQITQGGLSVRFRDNSESPGVLSGVGSLLNTKGAKDFDAYDPDSPGASGGLNFEHIICGHNNPNNRFSPRHGPFTLYKLPDQRSVMLVRDFKDCPWALESTLKYTVTAPHYIDIEFKCKPHNAKLFGSRGYAIFFFADYMNDVADVALHFRGIERDGGEETWIRADAPQTHPDWIKGGTYRHVDARPLEYDKDVVRPLNSWSYDYPRFTKPFYFGRAAHDMVFMMMFDRTYSDQDEIRFSLFKFKLDKFPRPAWDFQYVVHKIEEGKEYGYKARLVWKKFVSSEDCLAEYQRWTDELKTVR